jgi:hypothetical protein
VSKLRFSREGHAVEGEHEVREREQEEKLDEILDTARAVSSALRGEAERAAELNGKQRTRPILLPDLREENGGPDANGEEH